MKSMVSRILYIYLATSCFIPEHLCSRICFSCIDLQGGDSCHNVITCGDGEICYTQKYRNRNDETLYSFGCTYPELCKKDTFGSIFGRRSTEHSHVLCHKCCNSSVCNSQLECNDNFKVTNISCLSCGGVDNPISCKNTTTCGQDEVCYMHKYKTNSNNTLYDLGCKHSSACLNNYHMSANSLGKRTDIETHLTCQSCCSEYSLCNQNINCSHTNQKTINESCLSSSECSSNLVCTLGKCDCPTTDYYWANYTCLIHKSIGQKCYKTLECSAPLQCIDTVCKCLKGQYWNATNCRPQKTILEKCQTSDECTENLYCTRGQCKCDRLDEWTGQNCVAKKTYNELCSSNMDCQAMEKCVNNKCICLQSYWNGHMCQNTKPLECADLDFNTDGLFMISPTDNLVPVNCVIREGIKWTVFQRRIDGSGNFHRTWNEYKAGFGNLSGEFWLGNDFLHLISSNGQHRLRVELTKGGRNYYAVYSLFRVEAESNKYLLHVSGYSGNAGNSLNKDGDRYGKANGMMFTTRDSDNDRSANNCANDYRSGWWYCECEYADLNKYPGRWEYTLGGEIKTSMLMITRM